MTTYDYIIVGAGPAGLSLAWILSKYTSNILIIDSNPQIGGCHRINRSDNLYQTHGPKIIGYYSNYIQILNELDLSFPDLYKDFPFDITNIGNRKLSDYSFSELLSFILAFINLFMDDDYGSNISMSEFMDFWRFNSLTKSYIDQLCIFTDGRGADYYSLREFIQLANKQALYKVYLPKYPNDQLLFPTWQKKLSDKGITFMVNSIVSKLISNGVVINDTIIYGNNIILAIPPRSLAKLLTDSNMVNAFDIDINSWSPKYTYNNYLPITLHWNTFFDLDQITIFPSGSWNIAGIVISKITHFSDPRSKTVIECTITKPDIISPRLHKTANMASIQELVSELYFELKNIFPLLPFPTNYAHNLSRVDNKWIDHDTAFFASVVNHKSAHFLKQDSSVFKNIFNVGCHNGYHIHGYPFTSLEGAIQNSIALAHKLKPDSKNFYSILRPYELFDILRLIIIIFVVIFVLLFLIK